MTGEKYTKQKTILILFNHFRHFQNKNLLDAHFTFNDQKNHLFINNIESYEIHLPNYKNTYNVFYTIFIGFQFRL